MTSEEWREQIAEDEAADDRRWRRKEERCLAAAERGVIPCTIVEESLFELMWGNIKFCALRKGLPPTVIELLRRRSIGYSHEQIADQVGRPRETVRLLLRGAVVIIEADPWFGLYEVIAAVFHITADEARMLCRKKYF